MISGVDKFDDIYARMRELQEAAKPRCPIHPHLSLHSCLRMPEASKCGEACPHTGDWIGPQ